MEKILWDILMFYQIFLSLQVKQSTIISNKQGVFIRVASLVPSLCAKMKICSILANNYCKIENVLFPYGAISHENQSLSQIFFEWFCG